MLKLFFRLPARSDFFYLGREEVSRTRQQGKLYWVLSSSMFSTEIILTDLLYHSNYFELSNQLTQQSTIGQKSRSSHLLSNRHEINEHYRISKFSILTYFNYTYNLYFSHPIHSKYNFGISTCTRLSTCPPQNKRDHF